MSVETIKIIRGIDGDIVDAKLHSGLRAVDLTLVERQWSPWRQDIVRRLSERSCFVMSSDAVLSLATRDGLGWSLYLKQKLFMDRLWE